LLGGQELHQYNPEDLRRWFNVFPQNTYLFNGTIRENLLLANLNATPADLDQALHKAQLQELVETLPHGYQTWIGESGIRLSAGEQQRLALARAFLRDSPV
jgi:ABC-type multidrug transport system fused ATPase/permease subunit